MLGKNFTNKINFLIEKFDKYLLCLLEEDIQLKLIENPFSVYPEEFPIYLPLEVIELLCSVVYRNKQKQSSLQDFYKNLDRKKYKNLIEVALKTFCIFRTTYICEQRFSIMNINKNKQTSCLR